MKKHIIRTHAKIKERGWEKLYYAVDIHDTVIKANYCNKELPQEFFPLAKEVLQSLSNRNDAVLILFTCSHTADIAQYLAFFASHEIHFDYVNENPEVPNTELGNFDRKFYVNVYFEDKAGFDAERDWQQVKEALDYIDSH